MKENYKLNKIKFNNIYNYDAIEFMKKIFKEIKKGNIEEIDAIITDPPYNVSRKNNFHTMGRTSIDFGDWDKNFNQTKWIKYAGKIIKKNGSILIFNDWKNMGDISKELEKNGFIIKDLIRWKKTNPMPRNTNRRYVSDCEYIIWATKGNKNWTFNKKEEKSYLRPEIKSSVNKKNRIHPNQKPNSLIEKIILVHTNEGDKIYDPFSGSGEISYIAEQLQRKFLATEKNEIYFKKSIKRFSNNKIRPVFNHLGNKYRILDILLEKLNEEKFENFIEPFSGSGIVGLSYNKAKKYYLNDKEEIIIEIFNYLKEENINSIFEKLENFIEKYELIKNKKEINKEGFLKLKNYYNKEILNTEKERKNKIPVILLLIIYGFNNQLRFNSKGEFNIPPGKFTNFKFIKEKIKNFKLAIDKKNINLYSKDFIVFLEKILKKDEINIKKTIFYFDPPYLLSGQTYNLIWDEDLERKLLSFIEKIDNLGGKIILSNVIYSKGKKNYILEDFLQKNKNFVKKDLKKINYKNSNYQRKNISDDIEVLIWN